MDIIHKNISPQEFWKKKDINPNIFRLFSLSNDCTCHDEQVFQVSCWDVWIMDNIRHRDNDNDKDDNDSAAIIIARSFSL
jgi:hypothetical protein